MENQISKRKLSLIALITQIVFTVFAFMPCIFEIGFYRYEGWGIRSKYLSYNESILISEYSVVPLIIGIVQWLIVIGNIIGIIALIYQYLNKNIKYIKQLTCSPIVALISFMIESTYCLFSIDFELLWGFYIEFALGIAVSIMSFLIASGKVREIENKVQTSSNIENAKILKIYKELLDTGAMTQEEFDAKKKQLLDL